LRNAGEINFLFLSPAKVQQVRDLKTKREQAKIDEQHAIEERKNQRVLAKENRLRVEAERKAAWLADQARRAEEKATKKAEQQQAREEREAAKLLRQAAKAAKRTPGKRSDRVFNREVESTEVVEVVEAEELTATPPSQCIRTRKINLPQRLKGYEL
jgi:membrane protein involved in colicin uptake